MVTEKFKFGLIQLSTIWQFSNNLYICFSKYISTGPKIIDIITVFIANAILFIDEEYAYIIPSNQINPTTVMVFDINFCNLFTYKILMRLYSCSSYSE